MMADSLRDGGFEIGQQIDVGLAGAQPSCMSLIWFQRNPLPLDWIEQRRVVESFDA